MPTDPPIPADRVHEILARHVLVDGYPLVIDLEKSRGSWIFDRTSERQYLDFFSFFASNPIGFNHPRMLEGEIQERLARVATTKVSNSDIYSWHLADFVDTLSKTAAPPEMPHYFFIDGGALAVENGMKVAFDWKVRKNLAAGRQPPEGGELGSQILHFEGAFHGRSGYTLSVTNTDPVKTQYFPKFSWPRVAAPFLHFPLDAAEEERVIEAEKHSIAAIECAFDEHTHDIAAILIEPIQGEGGDRHFRPEFLRQLRRIADEREALLIFDEVQTGVGATGHWWAFQKAGVLPDVVCFAKKLQVGGILASRRVDEVEDNVFRKSGRINSTWGASLVDMVRATQILRIIRDENLLDNAAARGAQLLQGLEQLSEKYSGKLTNPRGAGLLCAIDLPTPELRQAVVEQCFEQGMMLLPCGRRSVRFRPTLNVSEEDISEGLKRFAAALAAALPRSERTAPPKASRAEASES